MSTLLQLLVGGVSLGAVYALLALGFVVVFKSSGVVNFAHPALLMLGAYAVARITAGSVPFPLALLIGVAVAALAGVLIQRLVVHPMAGRSVIAISIATIGVDVVVQTEIGRRLGADIAPMHDPWRDQVVKLGGLTVPQTRIAALAVCAVLIGAFFAWFKFSTWGVAMRAVAEDAETAALMGIKRHRVANLAWLLAGALAAMGGLFLTVFPSPGLEPVTAAVALHAFPAAIIGGLDSTAGAVVGGLVVGVAEVLTQGYANDLSFLGQGAHTVMPYVVMVLVLLVRPAGLFGTRELHRV